MRIVNLPSGSVFAYAGKRYAILKGMKGNETRFKIQEHCHTAEKRYAKKADQVYVFCFSTGQLGSFHNDTGVKHLPHFALPPESNGETAVTDIIDTTSRVDTSRRDALLEMITQYEIYKEKQDRVDDAKELRNNAREEYEAAQTKAAAICQEQDYRGTMVHGTMVIRVYESGITIHDGEILE